MPLYVQVILGMIIVFIGLVLFKIGLKDIFQTSPTIKCCLAVFGTVIMIIGLRLLGAN